MEDTIHFYGELYGHKRGSTNFRLSWCPILTESGAERLIVGGSFQVIGNALGGILWWTLAILLSRPDIGIGPAGYGVYGVVVSFVSFLNLFTAGVFVAFSRALQERRDLEGKLSIVWAFLIVSLISTVLAVLVGLLILYAMFDSGYIRNMLMISLVAIPILGMTHFLRGLLNGFYKYEILSGSAVMYAGGSLIFALFLLYCLDIRSMPINIYSVYLPLIQIFGSSICFLYLLVWSLVKTPIRLRGLSDPSIIDIRDALRRTLWCTLPLIIPLNAYGLLSYIFLSSYGVAKEYLGIMNVILGYTATMFLVATFANPSVPEVGRAYENNDDLLMAKQVEGAIKYSMLLMGLLVVVYISASQPLLYVFHTEAYTAGKIPFIVGIISTSAFAIEYVGMMIAIGMKRGRLCGVLALLTFCAPLIILSIALMLGLKIPSLSPEISQITLPFLISILTTIPAVCYIFSIIKKTIGSFPTHAVIKSVIAAVITILITQELCPLVWPTIDIVQLLVSIITAGTTYLVLLYSLKYFDRRDRLLFRLLLDNFRALFSYGIRSE